MKHIPVRKYSNARRISYDECSQCLAVRWIFHKRRGRDRGAENPGRWLAAGTGGRIPNCPGDVRSRENKAGQAETEGTEAKVVDPTRVKLEAELQEAETKAWDSLARYKFQMFGYWAAIWVHVNRLGDFKKANPWSGLVKTAQAHQEATR